MSNGTSWWSCFFRRDPRCLIIQSIAGVTILALIGGTLFVLLDRGRQPESKDAMVARLCNVAALEAVSRGGGIASVIDRLVAARTGLPASLFSGDGLQNGEVRHPCSWPSREQPAEWDRDGILGVDDSGCCNLDDGSAAVTMESIGARVAYLFGDQCPLVSDPGLSAEIQEWVDTCACGTTAVAARAALDADDAQGFMGVVIAALIDRRPMLPLHLFDPDARIDDVDGDGQMDINHPCDWPPELQGNTWNDENGCCNLDNGLGVVTADTIRAHLAYLFGPHCTLIDLDDARVRRWMDEKAGQCADTDG